jgi:hypothetical protein
LNTSGLSIFFSTIVLNDMIFMALKITTKYLAERDEDIRNFSYRKVIEKKLY